MAQTKDYNRSGLYAAIILISITLIILASIFLELEKYKTINLNSADIKTVDDRDAQGASIAQFVRTNQGVEFSCQIIRSYLDQPYCELVISIRDLSKAAALSGVDLSAYDQIGLWIQHNHSTQPGTRIELRNYNANYSVKGKVKTLKYNTLEYLEAYVSNPVWLTLTDFYIPKWWNNRYNLSLNNGGTDFSNIHTIAISPSGLVQEGSFKLTIEKIELRGKYFATTTLISMLIALWSLAIGYVLHRSLSPKITKVAISPKTKETLKFGAMSDPISGALNRIGLRKCFDQISPSDLQHISLIFINIDHFDNMTASSDQQTVDTILKRFVSKINDTCRSSDTIVRWNTEEFLLICPDTQLEQAVEVADKIRHCIQETEWPNKIALTCSSGVAQMYDEDLNNLIARANKALYSVKNTGSNRTAAA
jgi:diguanylate cyclase (GGDEF)-like protein